VIPEDWKVEYIENLAYEDTGGKNTQDRIEDGLYPFFVRSQKIERIDSYSYEGKAVLTAGDGVGTGKVFHYIDGRFEVHQRVYIINRFNEAVIGSYFYLCFSNKFYDRIMQMTAKSSVDSVRREMITRMLLPLPPLPEQRAIATALSDVDALIESLEKLIAKKRDVKQATMQQLLTGATRLPGFEGEWEVKRLGEVAELKSGYAFKSETYDSTGSFKVVTIANVQDGFMDVSQCNRVKVVPSDIQDYQRLSTGDILISMTGNVGRVCRVSEAGCLLNQRVGKINAIDVQKGLLFFLLRQTGFIATMAVKAKGGAQGNLSVADITEFQCKLPQSKSEQEAISTVLSDMDAEIEALEARRDKTKLLKQGMMQELLTGKTRLV
jgi:type I restriction enzyme S subunit